MDIPAQKKLERFLVLYKAYFGPFPKIDDDGLDVWRRFLSEVSFERIDELMEKTANEWAFAKSPRLKAFRDSWFRMRKATGQRERRGCNLCGKTGWMGFPGGKNTETGAVFLDRESKYSWAVPCECDAGQQKPLGFSRALQREVRAYRIERYEELKEWKQALGENVLDGAKQVLRDTNLLAQGSPPVRRWTP